MKWTFELKITLAYLIIGGLYIRFSDLLVEATFTNPDVLTQVQTYKGWAYVFVTGVFLYVLLKRHLEQLRKAELRARQGERLTRAFLQNISHEVRTPMNGIMGIAEILRSQDMTREEQLNYLETLQFSSRQLLKLVNDILDISRVKSDTLPMKATRFHLSEWAENLAQVWADRQKPKVQFRFVNEIPSDLETVYYDVDRLTQLVENVLDNAFKFTEEGQVTFIVAMHEGNIIFTIKDTGVGIPQDELPFVYECFRHDSNESIGIVSSTRLGLAITKGLVDLMDGEVAIRSTEGEGTEINIRIPLQLAHERREVSKAVLN
jgi:signal transduction histidine kinase